LTLPLKVVLLGTGGPRPDPRRNGPAAIIRVGDETLLFDTGRGTVVQLVRAGIALPTIDKVFITHHHVDHIGDLHDVIISTWMAGRKVPLRIFGPPDTKRIVNALLTQVYDKDIEWRDQGEPALGGWKPVEAQDVGPGMVLETERWTVSAETVVHGHGLTLSPAFLKRWICYGYRFESAGRVVANSGDTVDCGGLRRLAQGADVLVQCCYLASDEIKTEHQRRLATHTLACGDTVGKIAEAAGVKTLVLTHQWPRADDTMTERLRDEVARDFSGRLILGQDLDEISVP
jgi:ribonuclease Z